MHPPLPLATDPTDATDATDATEVEDRTRRRQPLVIDCDECVLQDTEACADCVVTFICGVEAERPVVVDLAEVRAMRLLGDAGLAPPLRHSTAR